MEFKANFQQSAQTFEAPMSSLSVLKGEDGITPQLRIVDGYWEVSYDDRKTWESLGVKATGDTGDKGETGDTGADGVGIENIEKISSVGLVDTYEITYTDGTKEIYTITNGENGADGKSAYEVAKANGYEGTEAEWLASLKGDVTKDDIVDNLTSSDTDKPLSAKQGAVLKDLIDKFEYQTPFTTDETLTLKEGVLSVNTAVSAEQDNTLPITSAAVYTQLGNIEVLLETI